MRVRWLGFLFLCACSTSDVTSGGSSAHLNGTVDDKTLSPRSAIGTRTPSSLTILVSDRTNTCALTHVQSAASLTLTFHGAQIAPGTFPVSTAAGSDAGVTAVTATFTSTDKACATTDNKSASSGSITLNEVSNDLTPGSSGSRARGSFTLTFPSGRMTGDFDALVCPNGDAGAAQVTCTP